MKCPRCLTVYRDSTTNRSCFKCPFCFFEWEMSRDGVLIGYWNKTTFLRIDVPMGTLPVFLEDSE